MRSGRGLRTSTSILSSKSKGSDVFKKTVKTNSITNKSNSTRKPVKEKNKDTVDIQPLVYSFRVPSNPSPGSVMNALLPPYWLYHDHAFGVIWMLFHQDKKYIGISQLHWCLRFLLDLKNTEGEYTGDVNVCIQAVQDDLIEQYANLGAALENQEAPNGKQTGKGKKDEKNEDLKNDNKSEDLNATIVESSLENVGENPPTPSPAVQQQRSRLSQTSKTSTCSSVDESRYIGAQSLTYNEMISRGPAPYTEQIPLEQIYKADGGNAPDIPNSTADIAAMLTSDTLPPDIPIAEMGTEELFSFLNGSRKEHVERIKKEVERLRNLEKFMEGVGKQGFKAVITGDLARRLSTLTARISSEKLIQ